MHYTLRSFFLTIMFAPALMFGAEEKKAHPNLLLYPPEDDQPITRRVFSEEEQNLSDRMIAARKAGREELFQTLHARLMELRGVVPSSGNAAFNALPQPLNLPPEVTASDRWGDDALVYSGVLRGIPGRRIKVRTAQDGTIFVAYIDQGTNEAIYRVRRSTDNGLTWSNVNGAFVPGQNVRAFAFDVADTTGGHLVGSLISVAPGNNYDGSLYWVSFHEDGTGWRATTVAAAGTNVGYSYPAVVSDAFNWSPGSTWWYGATSLVDSFGVSDMLLAWRTIDWGMTWIRDTVRSGWDDRNPSIDYNPMGADSVYIGFQYRVNSADDWEMRLAKQRIGYGGGTGPWPYLILTSDTLDQIDPDLVIGRGDGDVVMVFTNPWPADPSDLDVSYFYSADSGRTIDGPNFAFSTTRAERYGSIKIHQMSGQTPYYYAGCLDADTSVYTRTSTSITGIGAVARILANDFRPSPSVAPDVGSHDATATGTHIIYAGFGPTDIYYDGADNTVAVGEEESIPDAFVLEWNYPNPFNPSTTIDYAVPTEGPVTIRLYDVLGREVATVVNEVKSPGNYAVRVDASQLSTGTYFYRMEANGFVSTRKMMLVK